MSSLCTPFLGFQNPFLSIVSFSLAIVLWGKPNYLSLALFFLFLLYVFRVNFLSYIIVSGACKKHRRTEFRIFFSLFKIEDEMILPDIKWVSKVT